MNQPDENYVYFGKELFSIFEPKQACDEFKYGEATWNRVLDDYGGFFETDTYRRLRSACDKRQQQACDEFVNKAKEPDLICQYRTHQLVASNSAAGETKAASICNCGFPISHTSSCPAFGFKPHDDEPLPATNAPAAEVNQYDAEKSNQLKTEHDAWFNKSTYTLAMGIMELDTTKSFSLRGFKAAAIPRDARIRELEDTINDLRQKLAQKAVLMGAEFEAAAIPRDARIRELEDTIKPKPSVWRSHLRVW